MFKGIMHEFLNTNKHNLMEAKNNEMLITVKHFLCSYFANFMNLAQQAFVLSIEYLNLQSSTSAFEDINRALVMHLISEQHKYIS